MTDHSSSTPENASKVTCPSCDAAMASYDHGVCFVCGKSCGCSFNATSSSDMCDHHSRQILGIERTPTSPPIPPSTGAGDAEPAMSFATKEAVSRELCAGVRGARPSHPQLQADIRKAEYVALHSPSFRAFVRDVSRLARDPEVTT